MSHGLPCTRAESADVLRVVQCCHEAASAICSSWTSGERGECWSWVCTCAATRFQPVQLCSHTCEGPMKDSWKPHLNQPVRIRSSDGMYHLCINAISLFESRLKWWESGPVFFDRAMIASATNDSSSLLIEPTSSLQALQALTTTII